MDLSVLWDDLAGAVAFLYILALGAGAWEARFMLDLRECGAW